MIVTAVPYPTVRDKGTTSLPRVLEGRRSTYSCVCGLAHSTVASVSDTRARPTSSASYGSGAEIARRAADITLVGEDLGRLADLFSLSRRTARVMKQNLFWACGYNLVCVPLAVFGKVNPLVAAAAMLLSSLTVVFNTKRLRRQLERS